MLTRLGTIGIAALVVTAACFLFGPLANLEAKSKKPKQPPEGTVVSVTASSITIAYGKTAKSSNKSGSSNSGKPSSSSGKQMTFTCDGRTRVILNTGTGSRLVSPTMLSIGDRVRVAAFVLGPSDNKELFAHIIEIESQPKSKSGLPSFSPSSPSSSVSTLPSLSGLKP